MSLLVNPVLAELVYDVESDRRIALAARHARVLTALATPGPRAPRGSRLGTWLGTALTAARRRGAARTEPAMGQP